MTNELKATQRDAERYRYWRNKYSEKFGDADLTPENFDSVTDAQMLMASTNKSESALTQPVVAETQALEAIRKAAQSVLDDFDYGYPREYLELGQVRQLAEFCLASQAAPTSVVISNDQSLDIHIKGRCLPQVDKEPLALLYSDTVNDQMVRRDDLWIATTGQLAPQPALTQPVVAATQGVEAMSKEVLTSLIAEHLSGTLHCTRVWRSWSVGTMTERDFQRVSESSTPSDLADAILDAFSSQPPPSPAQTEAV